MPSTHQGNSEWLRKVRSECSRFDKRANISITLKDLKEALATLSPWKASGPDGVQGFWIKYFSSLHERIARQLQEVITTGKPPDWMTKGRTVLILKDPKKGTTPSNFRPITCLPLLWKVLSSILAESIYKHLWQQDAIPWEQKGCQKKSRGTKDHLVIDKGVMKDSKIRKTNLAMGWEDYKKSL